MSRKTRAAAKLREKAKAGRAAPATKPAQSAEGCENRPEPRAPSRSSLTPKRLRFAFLWAEADPEDRLQDVATRAGYSESFSVSGGVAELCRDEAIIEVRDRRLAELQAASRVTVEDTLIGLQQLAADSTVPPRDRVAARRALLAWYARDKGQHQPEPPTGTPTPAPTAGRGLDREARADFELNLLGVALEDETTA